MKFSIEIEPLPQPRPRFSHGRCYEPARITKYKKALGLFATSAMQGKPPTTAPVKILLKLWRKYKPTSKRYGDFDNHAKSICDALNKILWLDDSQVVTCTVEKYQGKPKVEIEVTEIAE